jgi:hypothetical protein
MRYLYLIPFIPIQKKDTQKKILQPELTLSTPPEILEPKKTPKLSSPRGIIMMNLFGDEKI